MEQFIGEIRMFAGNFAPEGWAFCEGQKLKIKEHTALFSIIGATYGGDARTTFALPDFRGRAPMHPAPGQAGESGAIAAGDDKPALPGYLCVNFIIALTGVFPSRG
jgi:microcystin-dependent protein